MRGSCRRGGSRQKDGHLNRHTLYDLIRGIAERAGVDGANVHRWRNTFGARFLKAGGDIGDLRLLLGHSDIADTIPYVAYGAMDRALAKQERFSPANAIPERRRKSCAP